MEGLRKFLYKKNNRKVEDVKTEGDYGGEGLNDAKSRKKPSSLSVSYSLTRSQTTHSADHFSSDLSITNSLADSGDSQFGGSVHLDTPSTSLKTGDSNDRGDFALWVSLDTRAGIPEDAVLNQLFESFLMFKGIDPDKKDLMRKIPSATKWDLIRPVKQEIISAMQRLSRQHGSRSSGYLEVKGYIKALDVIISHWTAHQAAGEPSMSSSQRKTLKNLRVCMKSQSISWLKEFTDAEGVEKMLKVLNLIQTRKNPSLGDIEIEHELVVSFRAYINNQFGFSRALQLDVFMFIYIRSLYTSSNFQTSKAVVESLAGFCLYSPHGHARVMKGLDANIEHFTRAMNDKGNLGFIMVMRFDVVIKTLTMALDALDKKGHAAYTLSGMNSKKDAHALIIGCLMLMNAICSSPEEIFYRMHLRNQLFASGLQSVLSRLSQINCPELGEANALIESFMEKLELDMGHYLDHFQIFQREWQDPKQLVLALFSEVNPSELTANLSLDPNAASWWDPSSHRHLLSIVQLLHFIKGDAKTRFAYYKLIAEVLQMIILDGKGIDPDFTRAHNIDLSKLIECIIYNHQFDNQSDSALSKALEKSRGSMVFCDRASNKTNHPLVPSEFPLSVSSPVEGVSFVEDVFNEEDDRFVKKYSLVKVGSLANVTSLNDKLNANRAGEVNVNEQDHLSTLALDAAPFTPSLPASSLLPPPPPPPPPLSFPPTLNAPLESAAQAPLQSLLPPPPPPLFTQIKLNTVPINVKNKILPWDKLSHTEDTIWSELGDIKLNESLLRLETIDRDFIVDQAHRKRKILDIRLDSQA